MPGLSKKETAKLLTHVERQGVVTTPVKNGVMLRLPNGESTVVHFSVSDHRGPAKLRAQLKRAGVDWPTDKTPRKMTPATIEKANRVMDRMAHPTIIRTHDFLIAASIDDWKPSNITVANYLYSLGYQGVGNTTSKRFVLPDPIVETKPVEEAPIVAIHPERLDLPPVPVQQEVIREFLDSHDSWTVDLDILPDTMTLHDAKLFIKAMGLSFELRVWK